ncbi:unnamed protein product [Prorocentrum cordatum]|uniref:Uncharacterized protein n=1 Tax=Prorocentrum cordatum TaxID=2364126 RepID=A0ABN9SQI5_9DINO|nr:unnamed protein product [Polarella glacialis]
MGTRRGHLPASVLHAQLCEYQQFRQGRRPRAPSDASAGGGAAAEPAEPLQDSPASAGARAAPRAPRARPPGRPVRVAGAPQFDEDYRSMRFEVGGVPYWVTKEQASGSLMLAERVASLCAARFREGARQEEVEAFREELLGQCSRMGRDAPDAPYESDAWPICQASCSGGEMVVNFRFAARRVRRQRGKGRRGGLAGPDLVHFRTSAGAAGGSVIQAERVARLCYEKFKEGASREDVRAYRAHLYRQIEDAGAKRKQGSG